MSALHSLCIEMNPHFLPSDYRAPGSKSGRANPVNSFTELLRKSKTFDMVGIKNGQGITSDYRLKIRKSGS